MSSKPAGMLDAGLAEDPAAARFGAEMRQRRVQAVQRNAEQHRQRPLERRRVEDRQIRLRGSGIA